MGHNYNAEQKRKYYQQNKESILIKNKIRYESTEQIAKRQTQTFRAACASRAKRSRDKNAVELKRKRRLRESLPDHKKITAAYRLKIKTAAFDAYGGFSCSCSECNVTAHQMLTLDHINNDGAKHRKEIGGGGYKLYLWLKKNNYPLGFRVLCFNCNAARHINGGMCPHITNKQKGELNHALQS